MDENQVVETLSEIMKELASKQEVNENYRVLFCALFAAFKVINTENSTVMFNFIQEVSNFIGKTIDNDNFTLQ